MSEREQRGDYTESEQRPSAETRDGTNRFDDMADLADRFVSTSKWFAASLAMVILWGISGPIMGFSETWQLIINTATTILTFLLVGLSANTASRNSKALQLKLNAIAEGIKDLLEDPRGEHRERDVRELKEAVGLEDEASS